MRKCELVERMQRELKNEHARRKKQRQLIGPAGGVLGGTPMKSTTGASMVMTSGGTAGMTVINTAVLGGGAGGLTAATPGAGGMIPLSPPELAAVPAPPGATAIIASSVNGGNSVATVGHIGGVGNLVSVSNLGTLGTVSNIVHNSSSTVGSLSSVSSSDSAVGNVIVDAASDVVVTATVSNETISVAEINN